MKLETTRERLYGGPLSRGAKYHYVSRLNGHQLANAETKVDAERMAYTALIGAHNCAGSAIYASVTVDGHVVTTREYQPGQVEFNHHRQADGRGSSTMLSRCEIDNTPCTVAAFHAHYLKMYNDAVTPCEVAS